LLSLFPVSDEFVGVEGGPPLIGLQAAVLLEKRHRLLPVGLRAPAGAALGVLGIHELDIDHQLLQRRLAVEVGLRLDARVDRGAGVLLRFFPRARGGAHEAAHEVGL
jgi:hypothetical protein